MKNKLLRSVWIVLLVCLAFLPASTGKAAAPILGWMVTRFHSANDIGQYASLAYNPVSQQPAIAYYDSTNAGLGLLFRAAPGAGTCTINSAWNCPEYDPANYDVGRYSSLAINSSGLFTVVSHASGASSRGNWRMYGYDNLGSSSTLDNDLSAVIMGQANSAAYDSNDTLWASYYAYPTAPALIGQLRVIHALNSPTGNCGASNYYQCETVDTGTAVGFYTSLGITFGDQPAVAYRGSSGELKMAVRGSSLNSNCSPANPNWTCFTIDNSSASLGNYISLYQPRCSGCGEVPHVAYYDSTNHSLKLAQYAGSGGNCGVGAFAGAWDCTTIAYLGIPPTAVGISTAMQNGAPIIAYMDSTSSTHTVLKEARYVFTGGNCGPAAAPRHWFCSVVDSGVYPGDPFVHSVGAYVSIAVNSTTHYAAIAYYNSTDGDLNLAEERRLFFVPLVRH